MVFVKYVYKGKCKKNFLFCISLRTNTKAVDIFEKFLSFFKSEHLEWNNLVGCCTDEAPAVLGYNSGFQVLVKKLATTSKKIHCMLHRQALASITLPDETVLEQIIQIINFIKPLQILVFLKDCISTWIQTTWCFSTILKLDGFPKEMQLEDSLNLEKK